MFVYFRSSCRAQPYQPIESTKRLVIPPLKSICDPPRTISIISHRMRSIESRLHQKIRLKEQRRLKHLSTISEQPRIAQKVRLVQQSRVNEISN